MFCHAGHQILELAPSLLAPVTAAHPTVSVLEGGDWVRARAWRDVAFEAQAPGHLCVHLIVASVGSRPGSFAIRLGGVCGAAGLPVCPKAALNATHLFSQYYAVPTVRTHGGSTSHFVLNDVLTPGATSVYALGCEAWQLGDSAEIGAKNLVNDGGFEDTELPLTPGFITCAEEARYPAGTFKGKCKLEDKHAGSWGLTQKGVGAYDGRAAFFVDSVMPHRGRHSGRIWLPSAEPIAVGVPGHTTNMDGIKLSNGTGYRVELWARSFPSGMSVEVTAGDWTTEPVVPNTPLGATALSRYAPLAPRLGVHVLGANWTRCGGRCFLFGGRCD
jgi:hypothetical protein